MKKGDRKNGCSIRVRTILLVISYDSAGLRRRYYMRTSQGGMRSRRSNFANLDDYEFLHCSGVLVNVAVNLGHFGPFRFKLAQFREGNPWASIRLHLDVTETKSSPTGNFF